MEGKVWYWSQAENIFSNLQKIFELCQSEFSSGLWAANQPDNAFSKDRLVANSDGDMKWSVAESGLSRAEVICQRTPQCLGDETYDENLNGHFLNELGKGIIIAKVVEVS